eukprot:763422-Hanusia_phi.AAC.3
MKVGGGGGGRCRADEVQGEEEEDANERATMVRGTKRSTSRSAGPVRGEASSCSSQLDDRVKEGTEVLP